MIEKFSIGVREGLTSRVAFELEPKGGEKTTYVDIWSRSSTLHSSGVPFSFCFLWKYIVHSLYSYTWSLCFFMGSTWTVPSIIHYSLKNEDEVMTHIPCFMGYGREPMVFSSISLVLSLYPILDQEYCFIWTIFLLISYTVCLAQGYLLRAKLIAFVMDPLNSIKLETTREAIFLVYSFCLLCTSFFPFFSCLPYPFPLLNHCVGFSSSFLPSSLCPVYILYQDLQKGNLNE